MICLVQFSCLLFFNNKYLDQHFWSQFFPKLFRILFRFLLILRKTVSLLVPPLFSPQTYRHSITHSPKENRDGVFIIINGPLFCSLYLVESFIQTKLKQRVFSSNLCICACVLFLYRKIPKISPGAYFFQGPFLKGIFLEGLIFGGAYLRREICVSKSMGLAL